MQHGQKIISTLILHVSEGKDVQFSQPEKIATSFAYLIAGIWVYCLIVAPLFSEASYANVVLEKSKDIGIGFTIVALLVGTVWFLIAKNKSDA